MDFLKIICPDESEDLDLKKIIKFAFYRLLNPAGGTFDLMDGYEQQNRFNDLKSFKIYQSYMIL
jgi:hypothetical protein